MKRRILSMIAVILLVGLMALPVSAASEGSLLLQKIDASVTLYVVADTEGNLSDAFAACGLDGINTKNATADTAKKLQTYALQNQLAGQTMFPDADRKLLFSSLEERWYLICSNAQPGEFAPFLAQIPTVIGEKTIYHIQATPKTEDTPCQIPPISPVEPNPSIPQTGFIQWPKYLLLGVGGILILFGAIAIVFGREKRYD